MRVRKRDFESVLARIAIPGDYAIDTETTGLKVWANDRLFSVIIAQGQEAWYFNFQDYPGIDPEYVLTRDLFKRFQDEVFSRPTHLWFAHNAKFDMAALYREGCELAGTIHCTEAIGRVQKNNRFNYKLETLVKDLGLVKSEAVDDYIKAHKLYRKELTATGETENVPCYDKVPFDVIAEYGLTDALITYALGQHQVAEIKKMQAQVTEGFKGPWDVAQTERALTKVFFNMERIGVKIDRIFSARGLQHERARMREAADAWKAATGTEFVDSAKTLAPAFDRAGEIYPVTEKGNPSFKAEVLKEFTSPLAKLVLDFRNAQKRANTYFANFLYFSDADGIIHPNMRQGGAETGRISYSDPNFQNLPKRREEKGDGIRVRRAVVPRPDYCLVMMDYDQQEYRLLMEYAREMELIGKVLAGLDVHEATAQMMAVERDPAKTLNFMMLYGGGVAKLCVAICKPTFHVEVLKAMVTKEFWKKKPKRPELLVGLDPNDYAYNLAELTKALELQQKYFSNLPRVKEFTTRVTKLAATRGWVKNWAGRVCRCDVKEFAYALPNHLIQGGCGDVIKIAMVQIDEFLRAGNYKTRIIIQVHDELLFEWHKNEFHLIPKVREIMEKAYPHKYLPLTVGIDHSWTSWADKVEGEPIAKAA